MQRDKNRSGLAGIRALFVSYNGALEPIIPSQGIPYLQGLAARNANFIMLTFEKKKDTLPRAVKEVEDKLKPYGIEWVRLPYHKSPRHLSTFFDIIVCGLVSLFLIIRKKLNVVHLRGIALSPMMFFYSRIPGVKFIFDSRGLLAEEYAGGGIWREEGFRFRLVKWWERRILNYADAVIVLTDKHKRLIEESGVIKRQGVPVRTIPCCVDTKKFDYNLFDRKACRIKLGWDERLVFMYPGKIGTFYLIEEMIGFFKFAQARIKNALFVLVSKDNPELLYKKAEEKGVALNAIRYYSGVYEEMPYYMSSADCGIFFINPYKKIGSSPIKLGEFLASGVPVLINRGIGDSEELVSSTGTGTVVSGFKEKDFSSALEEISSLFLQPGLREKCRATAIERLSLDSGVQAYSEIYGNILNPGQN